MKLEFEPIAGDAGLSKRSIYLKHLARCPQITSDYSFLNLWGWAEEYDLSWAWEEDLVWIRQGSPRPCHWAPIGPWQTIDWQSRFANFFPEGVRLDRIPELLSKALKATVKDAVEVKDARGHWDYLYDLNDLVALQGNRFHKKKNLVNQFKKKYDFALMTLGPDFAKEALALQEDWCLWRDCESIEALASENRVIRKVFANWNTFDNLMGAGILVEKRLVAYTVAEPLGDREVMIHFEKGNTDYKGVYQAINQSFLELIQDRFTIVNREQDLDDPGLRKAKESYHPSGFHKKFEVVYKG
jgi:hypothetical protein